MSIKALVILDHVGNIVFEKINSKCQMHLQLQLLTTVKQKLPACKLNGIELVFNDRLDHHNIYMTRTQQNYRILAVCCDSSKPLLDTIRNAWMSYCKNPLSNELGAGKVMLSSFEESLRDQF